MTKEEMTNEDAIRRLKNIDIRNALQEDYDALDMAIDALGIELLTDTEQRIFLSAIRREREVCQKIDDEYPDNDSKVSLVKVCDSIVRKVKKIWE